MLTCLPSGERRLFVDSALVGADWHGWRARADGHVLTPYDVVRRPDGHDLVIEPCVETLLGFVTRRRAGGAPLSPGEEVTVGVSVLRGCAELTEAPETTGEWWLTETGRPLFAAGTGRDSAGDASTAVLNELTAGRTRSSTWDIVHSAVTGPRTSSGEFHRAESALFGLAAPAPLAQVGSQPKKRATPAWDGSSIGGEAAVPQPLWKSLARHIDADLGEAVSRATEQVWRGIRRMGRRRSAPLLTGVAAAVVVLGVGLWWPVDGGATASPAGPAGPSPAVVAGPSPRASPTDAPRIPRPDAARPDEQDLAVVGAQLLDSLHNCKTDTDCRDRFLLLGAHEWNAGVVDLPADQRVVTLLDDFGGVAVLRVDAKAGGSSQLIVIAREEDKWLLRDVHDAALQPS